MFSRLGRLVRVPSRFATGLLFVGGLLFAGGLLAVAGCSGDDSPAGQAAPPPPPAAAEVVVVAAEAEEIIDYREFTGRTQAVDAVEIRPRVTGYLLQTPRVSGRELAAADAALGSASTLPSGGVYHEVIADEPPVPAGGLSPSAAVGGTENGDGDDRGREPELFIVRAEEGDLVQAGEPLFEIDPEPYRLAYLQAAGNLQATKGQLVQARRQLQRLRQLIAENAASTAEFDQAVAAEAEAAGKVQNLQAVVERAYLDWQYTQLRSPITGLVGRTLLTRGNLAVADTTVLTTVVDTDPMYVYFNVDENSVLDYNARVQQGQVQSARETTIEVQMSLANEIGFPHRGVVDFVNNTTDPETGNTLLRARFDNASGLLSPGLFARIRAPFTAPHQAVLVPTVALGADQQGIYVMVVQEGRAQRRAVETGTRQGERTAILAGVEPGELVIVSGLQRVRDGAPVTIANPLDSDADEEGALAADGIAPAEATPAATVPADKPLEQRVSPPPDAVPQEPDAVPQENADAPGEREQAS